jgi:hypothetical protein
MNDIIIRQGDELIVALSGNQLTDEQALRMKAAIHERIPGARGVTIVTSVSGLAIYRPEDRCPTCGEARTGCEQFHSGIPHTHQSPAYGAPLCTPERRLDHGHTVACGPLAGEVPDVVREVLLAVQAEVDAWVTTYPDRGLYYGDVVGMIRQVASDRGVAL